MAKEKSEEIVAEAPVEHLPSSWEEAEQQRKLKEFTARNAAAIKERRAILTSNGLADDTAGIDPSDIKGRCCG